MYALLYFQHKERQRASYLYPAGNNEEITGALSRMIFVYAPETPWGCVMGEMNPHGEGFPL